MTKCSKVVRRDVCDAADAPNKQSFRKTFHAKGVKMLKDSLDPKFYLENLSKIVLRDEQVIDLILKACDLRRTRGKIPNNPIPHACRIN